MALLFDGRDGARRAARSSWRRAVLAATATVLLLAGAVRADAPAAAVNPCAAPRVTNFLGADATDPGVISLYFFHAEGARVSFVECVGDRVRRLGASRSAAGEPTVLREATTWSCDRLARRFAATATMADGSTAIGTYGVRTMSCAQRFELSAPRRVAPAARIALRVVDRWGTGGVRAELCVTPPRERRACSALALPRAAAVATRRIRATTRGRWRIELRVRRHRERADVAVGGSAAAAAAPPTVLVTGDSTMQGIDGFLADALGAATRVRSDVRPGTGISKATGWLGWSASQARRLRPSATVMSIGPNEGFPMPTPGGATADCCADPWVAEYARRVRTMMRTYLRDGRGRVIWLTLPAPRDGRLTAIFGAVNRAVLQAASGLSGVTVLRMDLLFTPDGYRDVMRYRGRSVRVREVDGVHLNISGTAIAATAIARELASAFG